jgi:hypothetical protein
LINKHRKQALTSSPSVAYLLLSVALSRGEWKGLRKLPRGRVAEEEAGGADCGRLLTLFVPGVLALLARWGE